LSRIVLRTTVSVVVAAYNAEQWISATLRSIFSQSCLPLEVIVVDDGSTDQTPRILESEETSIRYERQEHRGQPAARNAGIRSARGEYVAFLDADDLWYPKKLESQIDFVDRTNSAWVICDADWIDRTGKKVSLRSPPLHEGNVLRTLFLENFIKSATPIVRRKVFDEVGFFDERPEARIGEDWDMWLRIAARYPLGVIPEALAAIRLHATSMIALASIAERTDGLERVVNRAVEREPTSLAALKNRALENIYYSAGVQLYREGRFRQARGQFLRGLRHRGSHVEGWAYVILSALAPGISRAVVWVKRQLW
jgi:glycosyltransferase involved in cell wall biosynthesis